MKRRVEKSKKARRVFFLEALYAHIVTRATRLKAL